ncbi:MAG: helicase [Burkholderiales bacterium]|nr:helicase [Burkholderiales bacterium]MDE1926986.1 helicase [Burkholderiales bacterium]MDE2158576.1 helicase [Burkholderiales bacterium]MDE2504347.1 helicase [Burkholderiales bacterium]
MPSTLPNPRHAARLPAATTAEQIARVRQAAYTLPQVVKPADFLTEGSPGFEAHLDKLGHVLLQKSVPGQQPSRWIEPRLFASALAHLDAVGAAGTRGLMNERTTALQALGVARQAGLWTRLTSHALTLTETGWRIPVLFKMPLDEEVIWAWYRNGDEAALQAGLGAPRQYPHAAELIAHLDALVARSRAFKPQHLASLLPRLQSECAAKQALAAPESLAELKAACTRAQERWAHAATELDTLEGLNSELAFGGYPGTFVKARRLQREVTLYVGPPNSGKTHAAFERLAQALDGAYLAPLRLLALEGRDRLVARGVPCSLLTGEENVPADGARVVSSTIEMVGTNTTIDVAVIDEAQMIFDNSRGWAWTQAIVAVPAKEVIIICSAYAVPAIEKLLGLCGERCTVRHFGRKQHVQPLPHPLPIAELTLGDAVVAFSRRDVLMLRDQIAAGGHPVSVIYGALPPEVRRREAERYASGASHILVATDAIGMGLNLPIRRVLFSTLTKFDGQADRRLSESEVHQIAGRAGRYGFHDEGHVGVLAEAEPTAQRTLKELLARNPTAPPDFKAPVAPNGWHVDTIAARLHKDRLRDVLDVFMEQLKLDDAHFAVAELEQMLELAGQLDECARALTLKQRFVYAQAPVDTRTEGQVQEFLGWAASHDNTGKAGRPWFLDQVDGHSRLERMEQALRSCTLWLWLDLRFPGVYGHVEAVIALRTSLNDGIERQLKGKRPLAQVRRRRA